MRHQIPTGSISLLTTRQDSGNVLLWSRPGQRGAMIFDDAGDLVWFHPVRHKAVTDFKTGVFHGEPVLTWWEGKVVDGVGDGEWVVVDAAYRELARFTAARRLPGDLHELVITPQSTALVTSNETVHWDLRGVGGSGRIVGRGRAHRRSSGMTGVHFGQPGVENERRSGLEALFAPRGIAVIGASASPGKLI